MSRVADDVFNDQQLAVRAESPLHHLGLPAKPANQPQGGVQLKELALQGHLILRGDPNNELFSKGVEKALGVALPTQPHQSSQSKTAVVQWLGPDEWLILVEGGTEAQVEKELHEHLHGHYLVVDVSGGQTILHLSGTNAEQVLQKSTGYDVHLRNFPVGKSVQTTLAKSTALIRRIETNTFELVVRRSFADYLWRWLVDASEEYGLSIGG
ncbi:sarcosine oxidase subunit gamma family protein [Endozoicomonas sp. SM1973]|uniref:Sarcosine oxidase subunit gamma family protein n=1 Tax=Spartinivicinus marinus TaxID=2994442 RepID=A0A853I3P5_9GAMM|nr:sarcosine oxidase subunit gamma family protein [Spartinivicinus marinus]MCX4026747.1 sarcosine oxidase subunit gamma family protein [Spartinivicinus marinus]NYZ64581.1 sarcosine oxidase subunit gamma family protein [Spartinivicinus marinus]